MNGPDDPRPTGDEDWMPLPDVTQQPAGFGAAPVGGSDSTSQMPGGAFSPPPIDLGPLGPGPPGPHSGRPKWLVPAMVGFLLLTGAGIAVGVTRGGDSKDGTGAAQTLETFPPDTAGPSVTTEVVVATDETEAPQFTDPPVTDPPVTDPPVTDPPVTDPPVTEPPFTEPPFTEPPFTEPLPEPLTSDQLSEAAVFASDLSFDVVEDHTASITAPCSDDLALGGVPATSSVSGGYDSTFAYSMQAGSFATAGDADDFMAYIAGLRPCRYVHSNGLNETMVDVRDGAIEGWSVLFLDYTLELSNGTVLSASDGYVSDGKVVGVFACSMGLETDTQLCEEAASVFIERLHNVADSYG